MTCLEKHYQSGSPGTLSPIVTFTVIHGDMLTVNADF